MSTTILERVAAVDAEATPKRAKQSSSEIIEGWVQRAADRHRPQFSSFKDIDKTLLLDAAQADDAQIGTFPTLWSLRDVDQESNLYLVRN